MSIIRSRASPSPVREHSISTSIKPTAYPYSVTSFKEEWKIPAMKYDEWNKWKNTNPWLISTNSGLAGTPVSRVLQISLGGITDMRQSLCIRRGGSFVGMENTAAVHTCAPIESDGRSDGPRLESSQYAMAYSLRQ
jgi:hypothetical protein